MAQKSININHSSGGFLSNDGTYIKVGENSAIKVGFGTSLSNGNIDNFNDPILKNYAGAIRINKSTEKLEYCNGTSWLEFITKQDEEDMPYIFSLIF